MDVSNTLEALKLALPSSQFALRGTDEYQTLNRAYQSNLNSEINPACIFQPKSKEDVSKFLSTIKPFVVNGQAAFAVVGGGRQPAPGVNNIEDGITVNLSLLKGIDIRDDYVSIAAGEHWGPVYEELGKRGLGCQGSRSANGGIGGLSLTGGLSFFSSRRGFVCDTIINYEVALASGAIVNANANENADLWLALRGGGNNFGIVTRFDVRTFKQGPMYGGSIYYFAPSFPGQIKALVGELQKPDASKDTHLMVSIGYTAAFGSDPVALNQIYYTASAEKSPVIEPFTSIEPQIPTLNTLRTLSLVDVAKEQEAALGLPPRSAYMHTHVKADVATIQAGADIFTAGLDPVKGCEGFICSFTLQPYPVSLLEASASEGGNSLGLSPSLGPIVSIALLLYWTDPNDDEKIVGTFKAILEKIDQESVARGQNIDYKYLNYSFTFQDPIGSYGVENKERLQQASKKYDPEGVFQKGVPGGWKLFP